MHGSLNLLAAATAGVAAFLVGAMWYSPMLFGNAWMREARMDAATMREGNPAVTYGLALVLTMLASLIFAMFLGPSPALGFALGAGASAGLCWVAASFGINYLFERKSLKLFLINGGYHTIQFTLYGLVLGLWK